MAKMIVHGEHTTKVPPRAARAWFWQYQPDDHSDPRFAKIWGSKPGDGRKVLSRSASEVKLQDTVQGRAMSFTVRPIGEDALEVKGSGQGWTSTATLRFEAADRGARIVRQTELQMGGLASLLMTLMGFKAKLARDVDVHIALMEQDWTTKPW